MGRVARRYVSYGLAECRDCPWRDEARGFAGRGARHHDHTGHEVETSTYVVYKRADDPAQLTIDQAPAPTATVHP